MTIKECALCGHEMTLERCGSAGAHNDDGSPVHLCHTDDHDCYHRFTVYRQRPDTKSGTDG